MSYFTPHVKIGPYEVRVSSPLDSVLRQTMEFGNADRVIRATEERGFQRAPGNVPYVKRAPKVTFFDGDYGNPSNLYEWKMALRAARLARKAARFNPWLNAIDIGLTVWQNWSYFPSLGKQYDFAGAFAIEGDYIRSHQGPCPTSGVNSVMARQTGGWPCLGGQVPDEFNGDWNIYNPDGTARYNTIWWNISQTGFFALWTMQSQAVGTSARGTLNEQWVIKWRYPDGDLLPSRFELKSKLVPARIVFPDPFGGTDYSPRPFSRSLLTDSGDLPSNYLRHDQRPDYSRPIAVEVSTQPEFGGAPPNGPREVVHELEPPTKGVKERKPRMTVSAAQKIMDVLGTLDEGRQIIDALYKALPNKMIWFTGRDGKWHMRHFGPVEKAAFLYTHWDAVDFNKAWENIMKNERQDWAFGKAGSALKKGLRKAAQGGYYRGAQGLQGGASLRL